MHLALLVVASVLAHHSFAAQYDASKPFEVRGVVTKVEWTNPHARFYVDVTDASGKVTNWNFELASPNVLVRNGWKRTTLVIGETLTVAAYLGRTGPPMAIASAVTTADGRKLFSAADPNGSSQ
jgi:hypothetical protein